MSATVPTQTRESSRAVLPSGLGLVQSAAAAVDGLVLSSITVHALVRLRLGAGTVGMVLAVSGTPSPLLGCMVGTAPGCGRRCSS